MSIICKEENTVGGKEIAAVSPTSCATITAQVGALCVMLGTFLGQLPQLTGAGVKAGALLVRVGCKLAHLRAEGTRLQ